MIFPVPQFDPDDPGRSSPSGDSIVGVIPVCLSQAVQLDSSTPPVVPNTSLPGRFTIEIRQFSEAFPDGFPEMGGFSIAMLVYQRVPSLTTSIGHYEPLLFTIKCSH